MKSRFSWKLILIHWVAGTFVMLGIIQLFLLHDCKFLELFDKYKTQIIHHPETFKEIFPPSDYSFGERFALVIYWMFYGKIAGFFLAFITSLILAIRNKFSWINAVIVLGCIIAIRMSGFLYLSFVKSIIYFPGYPFRHMGLNYTFLVNGIVLTGIGFFIFFNKWTRKFIGKRKIDEAENIILPPEGSIEY